MPPLGLVLLLSTGSFSADSKNYGNVRVAKMWSVYDGDTIKVDIIGWPSIIGEKISVRVGGIDAPKIRGKCDKEKQLARTARDTVKALLVSGKLIELRNLKRGKYFRLIADVYVDGKNLASLLIAKGQARAYGGGIRLPWC